MNTADLCLPPSFKRNSGSTEHGGTPSHLNMGAPPVMAIAWNKIHILRAAPGKISSIKR